MLSGDHLNTIAGLLLIDGSVHYGGLFWTDVPAQSATPTFGLNSRKSNRLTMKGSERTRPGQRLFDGRLEKRLRTSTAVHLISPGDPRAHEPTVTENVSPHGTRVISERSWQPGEEVIFAPSGEFQRIGRVVYCLANTRGRFCLGVQFPDRSVKWGDDS